jgi:hypothetical protein
MTKIIGFSGRKQSGKSTSADYIKSIIDKHSLKISHRIYSFADSLKQDICMNILGMTYEQCYGTDDDKNTPTGLTWNNNQLTARAAMEIIGTDIFRSLKNSVWVDATINKIRRDNLDLAIIADCRFPNEVESIKNAGGFIIRLDLDPYHSESPSECALDKHLYDWNNFDCIIQNSGMDLDKKHGSILRFLSDKGILIL